MLKINSKIDFEVPVITCKSCDSKFTVIGHSVKCYKYYLISNGIIYCPFCGVKTIIKNS